MDVIFLNKPFFLLESQFIQRTWLSTWTVHQKKTLKNSIIKKIDICEFLLKIGFLRCSDTLNKSAT